MDAVTSVATVGAVLAVDIGSLHTRAVMFDVVGDEYRFLARASALTTSEPPHADVTVGLFEAVRELENVTGRSLLDGARLLMPQRRDGNGLDLVIATTSAAPALRLVVAAVSSDISEVSATEAAQSIYTQVVSRITLDEGVHDIPSEEDALLGTAATAWFSQQMDKLLALPPDVTLIGGGVDGGPVAPLVRLAQVMSAAAREQGSRAERLARVGKGAPGMPSVIFAGNRDALESVTRALAPIPDVESVPNVRPELVMEGTGPAEAALLAMYRRSQVPQIPGYAELSRMIEGPVTPTAECVRLIARYLHTHYGRETLIADVGASSTSLFLASGERDAAVVLGDVGLAYGLGNLLSARGVANVLRWLPFEMSANELTDWALNKVIRPYSLPQTARDLAIEQAFAREALAAGMAALSRSHGGHAPRYDLLIGAGGLLAHAPRPGQAALIMLDALQPTAEGLGSVELALDTTMLIPALGNLARHHSEAAAYIFDRDCLIWLGTALVVQGAPPDTDAPRRGGATATTPIAVQVTVERQKGGSETVEVPYGSIRVIPLRPDQRASLTVKPGPGFRVGGGELGKALQTQPGQEVKGGLVGLIVDARGRPLQMAGGANRAASIRAWWDALDAVPSGERGRTGAIEVPTEVSAQDGVE